MSICWEYHIKSKAGFCASFKAATSTRSSTLRVCCRDPSEDGQASDYGLKWQSINSAHPDDFILYQTERYSESTFGYDIPIPKTTKPTNFVLVLKVGSLSTCSLDRLID
jgi:Malectin domain